MNVALTMLNDVQSLDGCDFDSGEVSKPLGHCSPADWASELSQASISAIACNLGLDLSCLTQLPLLALEKYICC